MQSRTATAGPPFRGSAVASPALLSSRTGGRYNTLVIQCVQLIAVCVLVASITAHAQWPQFRGPEGQGHAAETGIPLEWSESRNVAWKVAVPGAGWSSPVVGHGKVWLTSAVELDRRPGARRVALRLLAYDAATGAEVVNVAPFEIDRAAAIHQKNSHASPTPVLQGDRVYVHFGAHGTAAVRADGHVLWRLRLPYESQHGSGGSPILYEDLLIVNCDGNGGPDDAFVAAIDVATGKIRWRSVRPRPADQAYTTPLIVRVGGQDQLISVGAYRAVAYEPLTGREIWRVSFGSGFSNVPRPVFGHGLVYITTGFHQPAVMAVRPDGTGDVTRTHVVWTLSRGAPYTPSPLLVGDELYVVSDAGILTCVEATTGRVHWQERLGGNYSASPTYADGRIYISSEEGVTTVVAPGRDAARRLASNRLDGSMLASLAVADRSLFVRTTSHLYRIGGSHRSP